MQHDTPPVKVASTDGLGPNVEMPAPFDYCYEWDGPYGTRKFSAAQHNGMTPTRSVALFNEQQMRAFAMAALMMALRQNEHDMLMTGEELRACRAVLGPNV